MPHYKSPEVIPEEVLTFRFCNRINDTPEARLNKVLFAFIELGKWSNRLIIGAVQPSSKA
jgi:hypothetical protein